MHDYGPSGAQLRALLEENNGLHSVSNLWATGAVEGMRSRAAVARQIADLPDGARVRITVTE